ncbi:MAG: hypothetical protein FWD49_05480 [Firmicutes bacterium]|nr:hypothetical protein [Bacillota bacterium]
MLFPTGKTDSYNSLVSKNKVISFFIKSAHIIGIVLGVLFLILFFVSGFNVALLIVGIVFALAGYIVRAIMRSLFIKTSAKIISTYKSAYRVLEQNEVISFLQDNYGLEAKVNGSKRFICYLSADKQTLNFISNDITEIIGMKTFNAEYATALSRDFGLLSIPLCHVDSYMLQGAGSCVLIAQKDGTVCRITFDSSKFFDRAIPTFEFHFKTEKRA